MNHNLGTDLPSIMQCTMWEPSGMEYGCFTSSGVQAEACAALRRDRSLTAVATR